ncbi:MAG: hypothetical protein ACLP9L_32845 [Thermoguttaceae bacterium]
MASKANYHDLPAPDERGRIRPVVGVDSQGKKVRFTIGSVRDTTQADMIRRLDAIRTLYERQCALERCAYWSAWKPWADRMARGVPVTVSASEVALHLSGQGAEELAAVRLLQSWGLPVIVDDPQLPSVALSSIRQMMEDQVKKAVAETVAQQKARWGDGLVAEAEASHPVRDPRETESRTFHEAVDAYKAYLEATGKKDAQGNLSSNVRKCLEWLDVLKKHQVNFPVWSLDFSQCGKLTSYWTNRPITKKGTRASRAYAQQLVKQLWRFFNWLDAADNWKWNLPEKARVISKKVIVLSTDRNGQVFQTVTKDTYSIGQLVKLAEQTDAFGRAIIGVSVNCCFGASEIGQWPTSNFVLNKAHPHATKIGIVSTDADSWIVGNRPKRAVYGEHFLWPEVAQVVEPFLDGRDVLPITASGKPWWRPHSKNSQSHFGQWWTNLVNRVADADEKKTFPKLPFGSLRDLLADVLRPRFGDEVASLALQHGYISDDNLLSCYANLPFKRLFDATRELKEMFQPFLDVLVALGHSNGDAARIADQQ